MSGAGFRYEVAVAPDGRIRALVEHGPEGVARPILPDSPEGMQALAAGRDILYHFDDEGRLRDLAYTQVLEAMRQEVHLSLYKVRHGELLDEPELVPILRRLLQSIEANAAAFREAWRRLQTGQ